MAKEIPLSQNRIALVDDEDYEEVSKLRWHYNKGYAKHSYQENGRAKFIFMHRFIMKARDGEEVDHRNSINTLDNRRSNLRIATRSQNAANRKKSKHSQQPFKGIQFDRKASKAHPWRARIAVNGARHWLGTYATPEDAAKAYDMAALYYFGEFAQINDI